MKGHHIIIAAIILAAGQLASTWIDVYGYIESSKINCEMYEEVSAL